VFGLKQTFDFVTDLNLKDEDNALSYLIENRYEDTEEEQKIFAGIYIPRTLQELSMKKVDKDV
jgi:hypothetical protein